NVLRRLALAVFPPRDLYDYIANEALPDTGSLQIRFAHKYSGTHEMGVMTTPATNVGRKPFDGQLLLRVTCEAGGQKKISATLGESPSPWWGVAGCGVKLYRYEVPADMPIATPIDCRVIVESTTDISTDRLRTLRFYVRKSSEK